jgi:nitroreductase
LKPDGALESGGAPAIRACRASRTPIEAVMVAARAYGLHTCPQAAFTPFHRIVRRHLAAPDGEILLCGMALGHLDEDEVANRLNTERAPVAEFARFFPDRP